MKTSQLTIREVAGMAIDIRDKWSEAADRDAGFDGGEFSGPASDRAADKEIEQLSKETGFTVREIESEMNVLYHEDMIQQMADDGPYGRIV